MGIKRKQIGETENIEGSTVSYHELQPDVLLCINGEEQGTYLSVAAARVGAKRIIEERKREKEKKKGKKR